MSSPESGAPGCPFPHHDGAAWDDDARRIAEETARAHAHHSRLREDRAASMAAEAVQSRAEAKHVDAIDEQFVRLVQRKLGYGHPLSDRTGTLEFTWTPEAEARLQEVPEFCRELTRWRVEWTAHKHGLGTTITPDVMDAKYSMWAEVSHAIIERQGEALPWTDAARERLDGIPDFVKGQVMESVEGNARRMGRQAVDDEVIDETIARWTRSGDFHEGRYGFR